MKKLIVISAMAVFLSSMSAQADSTTSWEFDVLGDSESWHPVADSLNSLANGIFVTNGIDTVVLTSGGITGGDPGIETTNTVSLALGEFWDTVEFRARTVAPGGIFPATFAVEGMIAVANSQLILDSSVWDRTDGTNGWVVMSFDVSALSSNDLTYLRLDPPVAALDQNFEFDYIRIHSKTNAPPPPVFKTDWEFNSPGDLEGWTGGDVTGLQIANASSGESVLTITASGDADPQVGNYTEQALLPEGEFWATAEVRIRQLAAGVAQPWDLAGTLFLLNNAVLSADNGTGAGIGGNDWDTTFEANGWITTRLDISTTTSGTIFNMRIDPWSTAAGRTFEVDYVRFETRSTPILPPAPPKEIHTWEFNSIGDTEGWADNGSGDIVGMTVANAISGSEVVLTSSDIQGAGDSQIVWNGPAITPPGAWATWEVRFRQLTGNPADGGTTFVDPLDTAQVTFVANNTVVINLATEVLSLTNEANGWVTAVFDISRVGFVDLGALRIDAVANIDLNFEIDYSTVSSQGSKYDSWSQVVYGLEGTNALTTADPDGDTFNNLYEFGFGGDPTNGADIGFVESSIVDDGGTSYVEYNYARRTDSNNGLTYTFEQRDDLGGATPWVDLAGAAEVGTEKVGDDHEVSTNRVDTTNDDELFHRVEVSIDQ